MTLPPFLDQAIRSLPYVALFQNCKTTQDRYGEWECLLGLGDGQATVLTSWEALKNGPKSWKMGILPYQLKALFQPKCPNPFPAEIEFPEVAFFVPQWVLGLRRNATDWEVLAGEISALPVGSNSKGTETERPFVGKFAANFSRETYLEIVHRLKAHIKEGDFYELNFTQRFWATAKLPNPFEVYRQLTALSPVPFAAYIRFDQQYLICASPERFLRVRQGEIIAQPIKGTAKRGKDKAEDEAVKLTLQQSEKERAENVMIVDLMRNDLYRHAVVNSVQVPYLFEIQTFPQVHQLVSTITARLAPDASVYDLLADAFPPGSMTGAPKVRVMQAIDQYERVQRGAYSGCAGYLTPQDDLDLNVIIRSLVYDAAKGLLSYHVGGAITYDSEPEAEYAECLLKAQAIQQTLDLYAQNA